MLPHFFFAAAAGAEGLLAATGAGLLVAVAAAAGFTALVGAGLVGRAVGCAVGGGAAATDVVGVSVNSRF